MASTEFKRIKTITVPLDTHAGALCEVYVAFRNADINVNASWGYEMGPGNAEAILYVDDVKKALEVLKGIGKKSSLSEAVWACGDDQIGAYVEPLEVIAEAGINLHATDAMAVGNKFVTVFFCSEADIDELCNIVKAK